MVTVGQLAPAALFLAWASVVGLLTASLITRRRQCTCTTTGTGVQRTPPPSLPAAPAPTRAETAYALALAHTRAVGRPRPPRIDMGAYRDGPRTDRYTPWLRLEPAPAYAGSHRRAA